MRLIRAIVGICAALAGPGLGLLGCGGDKSTASASEGASESNSSGDTSEPTGPGVPTESSASMSASQGDDGGSMSASMSGTTEISGGMSASMSGSEDSGVEPGTTTSGTTGMVSGSGETSLGSSTTGEPVVCNTFDTEAECVAAGCLALKAQLFFDDGAGWCVNAASFLSCTDQVPCDDVITTACKGQTKYQFPSGCLPPGFMPCEAPPDAGMDGYPDCN